MIDRAAERQRMDHDVALLVPNPEVARRLFWGARLIQAQRFKRTPNWSLVTTLYGVGSTYAWAICQRMGVDGDATTVSLPYAATPEIPPAAMGRHP